MSCSLPEHGGRLREAARRHGIPLARWLDLSTGINPQGWPVPELSPALWQCLPDPDDGLCESASAYYGSTAVLPVAGTQAAIQALPQLRPRARVGVLSPGYAEHAHCWARAGHRVQRLPFGRMASALDQVDVLVVINPGNPGGERFDPLQLLEWHARLAQRGGWLVVDEAFIDTRPDDSLAPLCPRPGLIVLRSLGKFFGLAGARVGFVLAEPGLLARLDAALGPWPVSGPARWVARQALEDRPWQARARLALAHSAARLERLLEGNGLAPSGGCELFVQVTHPHARGIARELARQAILVRCLDRPEQLRLGLPGNDAEWQRLEVALQRLRTREAGHARLRWHPD